MPDRPPSRRRRASRKAPERDESGRILCRECHTPVPRGRYAYCSDAHAVAYLIRVKPEVAGLAYRQEYGSRCRACGQDEITCMELYERAVALLRGTPCELLLSPFKMWELDHIRPVADGGGECGLDNYRLLCSACHGNVTASWRRERSLRGKATGPWAASARSNTHYRVPLPSGG